MPERDIVERLRADAVSLRNAAENISFMGEGAVVRVKDPALLATALLDGAAEITALREDRDALARVWLALGIETYEDAGGKEISEIVTALREKCERYRKALEIIMLTDWGRHGPVSQVRHMGPHAKLAAIALRAEQALPDGDKHRAAAGTGGEKR